MDYTLAFDAPPETIYGHFTSAQYWDALMGVYRRFTPSDVTRFHSDEHGTDIEFVQVIPRSELPTIARKVIPADMVITRTQHFDPFDRTHRRAEGTYAASIPRGPGRFSGTYTLTEADTGSQLLLASVCKVWIPLLGGPLEDLMLHHVKGLFDAEEEFTAHWLARDH
ncbi:Protein of unknown function [Mycolicibacterium rutilum]|uniref:DUF2505 domain-containing protein n=2 Tax=Mycolicibacterium rutilum TaxID=370526 RepID=A0A1H6ITB1_MYCRU|nr:Protein of unknown function [Mycolicibacterium rutilum]